jgi:hypothetical protein
MQWLCRLVTPKGGTVLDPFAGTGTTGEAAFREGFKAVLIEREEEYQADIRRRMALVICRPEERKRESIKAKRVKAPHSQEDKMTKDEALAAWDDATNRLAEVKARHKRELSLAKQELVIARDAFIKVSVLTPHLHQAVLENSSAVERLAVNEDVAGSSPASPATLALSSPHYRSEP